VIGCQDVVPVVEDEDGRDVVEHVQHAMDLRPCALSADGMAAGRAGSPGPGALEQIAAFDVI